MSITDHIAHWIGIAILFSLGIATLVGMWWGIITLFLNCAKETWYIAAWNMWKVGQHGKAKKALRYAIENEKAYETEI